MTREGLRYTAQGQWNLFRGLLEESELRIRLRGSNLPGGEARARAVDGRGIDHAGLDPDASVTLPQRDR